MPPDKGNDPTSKRDLLWDYVIDNSNSFEAFIKRFTATIEDHGDRSSFCFKSTQLDYLTDEAGRVNRRRYLPFESFEHDFRRFLKRVAIWTQIPHENPRHISITLRNTVLKRARACEQGFALITSATGLEPLRTRSSADGRGKKRIKIGLRS